MVNSTLELERIAREIRVTEALLEERPGDPYLTHCLSELAVQQRHAEKMAAFLAPLEAERAAREQARREAAEAKRAEYEAVFRAKLAAIDAERQAEREMLEAAAKLGHEVPRPTL